LLPFDFCHLPFDFLFRLSLLWIFSRPPHGFPGRDSGRHEKDITLPADFRSNGLVEPPAAAQGRGEANILGLGSSAALELQAPAIVVVKWFEAQIDPPETRGGLNDAHGFPARQLEVAHSG